MESAGARRITDRWIGEPVEVAHHVQEAGVLSVGSSAGTLEETDDMGILLSVQNPEGSVEERFFPWASLITIATTAG
jgi:hypothetical protein